MATRRLDDTTGLALARGLGWVSVGLGIAGLTASRGVARAVGVPHGRGAVLAVGFRELVSGVALLARPRPAGYAWSRVAGQVIDLALLVAARRLKKTNRKRIAIAAGAISGLLLLDLVSGWRLAGVERARILGRRTREVRETLTIRTRPSDAYAAWRDLARLPRFMVHLVAVDPLDERRSHWTARTRTGDTTGWTAEIIEDVPGERIAWRTTAGHAGVVRFRPRAGGTEVDVQQWFDTPRVLAHLAKLFGEHPAERLRGDLQRLKRLLEG
jgi:uncharacterized membrane protein